MKTLIHTIALALSLTALQAHAQSQDTDWKAVLQEAQGRADAKTSPNNQDGQRLQEVQALRDEAAAHPLTEEAQAVMDEATARAEGNKGNTNNSGTAGPGETFCGAVMCLSNGAPLPEECKTHIAEYFKVRVEIKKLFKKVYDPIGTAIKRNAKVLTECKWTRPEDQVKIAAKYGTLYDSPF